MAFDVRVDSAPPHPKATLFVPRGQCGLCIVLDPRSIPSTSQLMVLINASVQATIHSRVHELFFFWPKRPAKLREVMKENAFECLAILATSPRVITEFLKNPFPAQAAPIVSSLGPASSSDH